MAIFKCKMCGGSLEVNANETVTTCEYCGTQQTLPKTDDDVISNLFNRANNLRLKCEFDKAAQIYEKIVEQDDSEAEAHWGIVLCKYGIEYVEDPKTGKRIPTCHRTLFEAVTTDTDYLAAVDYSDALQQRIYESEARAIDRIQKDILAIVKNEKPFDVFICYKETDESGKRTIDSTIANDIYYQLTQEGLKVFFAAITLEDKLGQEYEPYIFAALNSAKVMLVLGTKPEYFSAVWVKNEWSRFLQLMKTDRSKLLIPCYRDMDAYDLPEEFAHLQAQDMGKIGFINDVVRGIKKVAPEKAQQQPTVVKETVVAGGNTNIAPLLKRAFMFLEDGEFDRADDFCEQVLNQDPECAEAYLGKLMAELQVKTQEALKNVYAPFDDNNYFQKVMRFGDDNLKNELQEYIDFIVNRNLTNAYNAAVQAMEASSSEEDYKKVSARFKELQDFKDSQKLAKECLEKAEEARLTVLYNAALSIMTSAQTEKQYQSAGWKFDAIDTYKDAGEKAKICFEKAEIARKDAIYSSAVSSMEGATIPSFKKAIEEFKTIEDWKDSSSKIYECERSICKIEEKAENSRKNEIYSSAIFSMKRATILSFKDAIAQFETISDWKDSSSKIHECERSIYELERKAEECRMEAERIAKRNKKIASIVIPFVCVVLAFVILLNSVIIPNGKYNDAITLMEAGNYTEAITAFEALDGYKDSATKINECNTAILDIKYNDAIALKNAGKYDEAIAAFEALDGYKDNATKINECKYDKALALADAGNIVEAYEILKALGGFKDSAEKANYIYDKHKTEKLKTAKAGDYVLFGTYEQDNNTANGKEAIEWLVLEVKNGKMLVISKYALDCKQYNASYEGLTWETCTLRKWLNNDFANVAFTANEKAMIPAVKVSADKNPVYTTVNQGKATQDHLFLLSITEVNKYFSSDGARQCKATAYAINSGAYDLSGNTFWWLRSPGAYNVKAAFVDNFGDVSTPGYGVDNGTVAVRPAMWIDISK